MVTFKNLRYIYWLVITFLKNNLQPIIISFVSSILIIIFVVSISPYLIKTLTSEKKIIGIAGIYSMNNLPESITSKISNGLVYVNNKGDIVPMLAESWEALSDNKEFRIQIKRDLVWNDNVPFRASDINYAFKDIDKKIIDDNLLIYSLKKPLPIFPIYLTKPVIRYPLIGVAGLYKAAKIRMRYGQLSELELTPNKPDLPILIYRFFDGESKLITAYKLGQIEEMTITNETVVKNLKQWPNTKVERTVDYSQVLTLFFNLDHPLLGSDKDIRKAISASIPRENLQNYGELAIGPLPPTSWAYDPHQKQASFDLEKAKKILSKFDESSKSANFTIKTSYDNLPIADIIKANLEKVGLRIRVEIISAYLQPNFDYELFLAALKLSTDPDQYFYWHSTQKNSNISRYKSVKVDKLLEDGRSTLNPVKRKEIYSSFQKTMLDDYPASFLYYPYQYIIQRK